MRKTEMVMARTRNEVATSNEAQSITLLEQ